MISIIYYAFDILSYVRIWQAFHSWTISELANKTTTATTTTKNKHYNNNNNHCNNNWAVHGLLSKRNWNCFAAIAFWPIFVSLICPRTSRTCPNMSAHVTDNATNFAYYICIYTMPKYQYIIHIFTVLKSPRKSALIGFLACGKCVRGREKGRGGRERRGSRRNSH